MRPDINQIWEDHGSLYKITEYFPIDNQHKEEMWNYKLLQPDGTLVDCDNLIETEVQINKHFKFVSDNEETIFNINEMFRELCRNKGYKSILEKFVKVKPYDKEIDVKQTLSDNKNVK